SEIAGTVAGLDEAADLLGRVRAELNGPQHPYWLAVNEALAWVHHRDGHRSESLRDGQEAQRSYAWRGLRQADPLGRKIAIRQAATDAIDLARTSLATGPAEAIRALDTGRGLMLFAATALRGVGARLVRAGRADLADRWVQAGGDERAPGDLRREVLTALAD